MTGRAAAAACPATCGGLVALAVRLPAPAWLTETLPALAAARGLATAGRADGARLAIKGGSAGGWTVLCALADTDVFAAGISRYGVADLRALAADTHDFEARYLDRLRRALVGMDAAEEQEIVRTDGIEREIGDRNAVVDRRGIVQRRMTIRLADRDIVHAVLIGFVHWQDAIGREAVDRRHHRRIDQRCEGVGGEIRLIVDQVEPARLCEQMGEVGNSHTLASIDGSSE